jgi:kynurenine formamidase
MSHLQIISTAAERHRNWGRWGPDDTAGTTNFIDADKVRAAAGLVRRGAAFSLALPFDETGPQTGALSRVNPIRTMTSLIHDDAEGRRWGFAEGFGGADDAVFMPLQCGTQWDGLGHIFDRGFAWNGRPAARTVTYRGDDVAGIEHLADRLVSRGVLLDVARARGVEVLEDGFPITEAHLLETIDKQGPSARVGRGDIVLVRTGQLGYCRARGWGTYAGGPAPGLSFGTADWLFRNEVAAAASDTWGFEIRPNEIEGAFQPLHIVLIPNMGMPVGEMWDLDRLAEDCANDGTYEFLLVAPPLPFTRAVGSPINPVAIK